MQMGIFAFMMLSTNFETSLNCVTKMGQFNSVHLLANASINAFMDVSAPALRLQQYFSERLCPLQPLRHRFRRYLRVY